MLFPIFPILEKLKKNKAGNINYDKVFIVSVQHLLNDTGSLFSAIIDLGISPKHIYLQGKIYSTSFIVERLLENSGINIFPSSIPTKFGIIRESLRKDIGKMWNEAKKNIPKGSTIIILDDGGLAIKQAPAELYTSCTVYGIEQTTSGLRFQPDKDLFPIIQVATSAAKVYLEPNYISKTVSRKLEAYIKNICPKRIGIVGCGHIGKAIALLFSNKEFKVFVYDTKKNIQVSNIHSITICDNMDELVTNCDFIIGATGVDISNINWESLVKEKKTLLSASSNDIEFNTLLKQHSDSLWLKYKDVLKNIEIKLDNGNILKLIRGGSVANFDNTIESSPKKQGELTISLLFAAVLQALNNNIKIKGENGSVNLKPSFQSFIVQEWFRLYPSFKNIYPQKLIINFRSENWIDSNSGLIMS